MSSFPDALVISFAVIVGHTLSNEVPEVPLAQRHDALEALGLDRPDETLSVRVAVRRRGRRANNPNTNRRQERLHRVAPRRIAVADQHRPARSTSPSPAKSLNACTIKGSSGYGVEPRTWTRRDRSSMTNAV